MELNRYLLRNLVLNIDYLCSISSGSSSIKTSRRGGGLAMVKQSTCPQKPRIKNQMFGNEWLGGFIAKLLSLSTPKVLLNDKS